MPARVRGRMPGGRLLDRFHGTDGTTDGAYSEEWIASTAAAGDPEDADAGLSRIRDADDLPGPLFADVAQSAGDVLFGAPHHARFGPHTGLDCRFIDCADTGPPVCRPAGPTCLCVIGTRDDTGREPALLVGDAGTPEPRRPARIVVAPGQIFYLPPGTPYRAGAGMLVLQVAAAGDSLEERPFSEEPPGTEPPRTEEVRHRIRPREVVALRTDAGVLSESVTTDFPMPFSLCRAEIRGEMDILQEEGFSIIICAAGAGRITWAGGQRAITAGEYFLQPWALPWITFTAEETICLIIARPAGK